MFYEKYILSDLSADKKNVCKLRCVCLVKSNETFVLWYTALKCYKIYFNP